MSNGTTKNVTDSTTITKQEIRFRLRGVMKVLNVEPSTDPYRFLLEKGALFVDVAAVKTDPVVHAYVRRFRPKPKECFYNGQWFVVFDETDHATYYEGFVSDGSGRLIHHGWLVVNGVVIDPTLEAAVRKAKRMGIDLDPPATRRYYGVPFTKLEVAKSMASGVCCPRLNVFNTL
jgi:hypothetical protein